MPVGASYDTIYNKQRGKIVKLSARNVMKGTVKSVKEGAVNDEIVVEIAPAIEMTSIITSSSCQRLDLAEGKEVYVLVKASNVMIAAE